MHSMCVYIIWSLCGQLYAFERGLADRSTHTHERNNFHKLFPQVNCIDTTCAHTLRLTLTQHQKHSLSAMSPDSVSSMQKNDVHFFYEFVGISILFLPFYSLFYHKLHALCNVSRNSATLNSSRNECLFYIQYHYQKCTHTHTHTRVCWDLSFQEMLNRCILELWPLNVVIILPENDQCNTKKLHIKINEMDLKRMSVYISLHCFEEM